MKNTESDLALINLKTKIKSFISLLFQFCISELFFDVISTRKMNINYSNQIPINKSNNNNNRQQFDGNFNYTFTPLSTNNIQNSVNTSYAEFYNTKLRQKKINLKKDFGIRDQTVIKECTCYYDHKQSYEGRLIISENYVSFISDSIARIIKVFFYNFI